MWFRNLNDITRKLNENRKKKPLIWEWKEELRSELLYAKMILNSLKSEMDFWFVADWWKHKEQMERALKHYDERYKKLCKEWKKQILLALKKSKDEKKGI